jgi:hypothetical protein
MEAGMEVFVLMEAMDKKADRPVGVVTSIEVAEQFYQEDPHHRDYIPLKLDMVPGISGKPLPPTIRHPAEEQAAKATMQMQETNRLLQEFLKRMNKRK